VCIDNGIPFIVDETKTGLGITGKMWGHEHWYLHTPPDYVTFGGKTGISGYYSNIDSKIPNEFRHPNGNPISIIQHGIVWRHIQKKQLLELVLDTGTFLKIELGRSAEKGIIGNLRGYGTYIGFDAPDTHSAKLLQRWFQRTGFNVQRCGPQTFGLRPALVLGPTHAASFRDSMLNYSPNAVEL